MTVRSMTRKECSELAYRALVWVRDLKQPEIDAVEARVYSHVNGYVNLLLPSGEVVSVAYDTEVDLDWPSTDGEPATSEDGAWLVVEEIDVAARIAAEAERLETAVQKSELSHLKVMA